MEMGGGGRLSEKGSQIYIKFYGSAGMDYQGQEVNGVFIIGLFPQGRMEVLWVLMGMLPVSYCLLTCGGRL